MGKRNVDLDIKRVVPLVTPHTLKGRCSTSTKLEQQVRRHRGTVQAILDGQDRRMLAIVGPCSIHDPDATIEYARRLAMLAQEVSNELFVVMRAYYQKPRTTTGWKGLFLDPDQSMNGGDVNKGARLVREISLAIASAGLPIGTEVLDQYMIQFIDDITTWACIGARTVESQPHRELASGLSTPVGMKNSTDGRTKTAIEAIITANHTHGFIGMDEHGRSAWFSTTGNRYAHIVLRGGGGKPNCDRKTVATTIDALRKQNLRSSIIIDAAHENSNKDHEKQRGVVEDVIRQRLEGNDKIVGFMVESNLVEGNQEIPQAGSHEGLVYGQSITDPCISFRDTERLLRWVACELRSEAGKHLHRAVAEAR